MVAGHSCASTAARHHVAPGDRETSAEGLRRGALIGAVSQTLPVPDVIPHIDGNVEQSEVGEVGWHQTSRIRAQPFHASIPGEQVLLTLAVIGPAHALKGEVRLDIRTDDPEGRLAPGTTVPTDPTQAGPLTVSGLRFDGSRWFAAFEQVRDRTAAEAMRGVRLLVETDDELLHDNAGSEEVEESWYRHELVGLRALSVSGEDLGEVTDLEPGVAQDRLVVTTAEGDEIAVPFVAELVPAIDAEAGTVTLDPPGGLFPGHGQVEEAR